MRRLVRGLDIGLDIGLGSTVLLVCLLLAGCGDDPGPSSTQVDDPATAPSASSPTSTPNATTPTATTPNTGNAIPVLRMADAGTELELAVGGTASIALPRTEYDWSDPTVEGDAVTVSEDISDEGSTSRSWTVTAVTPGTARVAVAGSPPCRASTPPCGAPDIQWSVRITVS